MNFGMYKAPGSIMVFSNDDPGLILTYMYFAARSNCAT